MAASADRAGPCELVKSMVTKNYPNGGTMDEPELFSTGPVEGDTVRDMRSAIEQWQLDGKVLGAAQRRALLDQALACDLAKIRRSATNLTGATGCLADLMREFGLLGDTPPPGGTPDDPLGQFLSRVEAAANGSPD